MKSSVAFLKVLALAGYGLATIATCSAVWNAKSGPFLSVVAALLLLSNGYVIYRGAKALEKEKNEKGSLK